MTSPIHTAAMCKFGHTAAVFFYFVMLFSGIIHHNFVSSLSIFCSSPFTTSKAASGADFGIFSVFCCLTFAWFTSKDEVTNRLSANADYDVSIVESFSPPKNWLPGQEVNKDVYAVNTGNIAAFVNEDVSGVMNVTYEVASDTFVKTSAVKLNDTEIAETMIDGVTAKEGGSFLAFTTSSAPTGYLVSSRTEDNLSGRFVPTEEGVYIFRRSIDVGTDGTETYTYDGYYFDGTDYYKIKIDSTTVKPNTEGELSAATYKYVLDLEETAKPVGLYYDEANTRLVATYALDPAASMPYDADAIAARNAVDLANATAAKTTANTNKSNADTALSNVNTLIDKRNKVVEEARKLNNLITTSADKTTAMNNADSTVNDKVNAITVPTFPTNAVKDTTAYPAGNIKTSVDKYNGLIDTVKNTNIDELSNALETIRSVTPPSKVSDTDKNAAATKLSTLKTNALALYQAYAEIKDSGAAYDTDGTIKTALEAFLNQVNALDLTELNNAITAYNTAVDNNTAAADAVDATAYGTALSEYTTALGNVPDGVTKTPYEVANTTAYANTDAGKAAVKANAELSPYPMQHETADTLNFTVGADTKTVAQWDALSDAADAKVNEINARQGNYSPTSGNIEIYINLDPTYASAWQIEPGVKTKVASGTQETQETVSFYLKHILDEGKTSEKLIDSVTLSPDTQDVFKSFDFDLNVALDSAQITYADDQKTIKTDAVQAPAFGATPTLTTPTDINTGINWA